MALSTPSIHATAADSSLRDCSRNRLPTTLLLAESIVSSVERRFARIGARTIVSTPSVRASEVDEPECGNDPSDDEPDDCVSSALEGLAMAL
mmetsp:Transcript_65737/g.183061  ORF Transcript_65737/g.183061 Transcript_65737/m.183061 type:complete len:92 (+) Transcript_65737:1045-1320(+)